jgi:hypothetical protein
MMYILPQLLTTMCSALVSDTHRIDRIGSKLPGRRHLLRQHLLCSHVLSVRHGLLGP